MNVTVLLPCVGWKFVPLMVITPPTAPEVGDKLEMAGVATTVKLTPTLATLDTVMTTFPVVAPVGTGTTMLVSLQLVGVAVVPLNLTVLVPWVAPKLVPLIVIEAPTIPEFGERLVIPGATVNAFPALATPFTVTTTFPLVAPLGTGATIDVALQLLGVVVTPLNLTVLLPCVDPNVVPVIVTDVPMAPVEGDNVVMEGATVNAAPLLAIPPTVTTTLPVVAVLGTGALICVEVQLVGVAVTPLNLTVLAPCVEPKLVPLIVIDVPTAAEVGDKLVIFGAVATVKVTPLLATPPTVTTTLPVVAPLGTGTTIDAAPQLVGVAVVPLNLTVLVPWVAPKLVPAIVTDVPTAPLVGESEVIPGVTVNDFPALATPPTVTTTLPVVAPVGTGATIEVALQLVGVAVVPLNLTVLVP